MAPLQHRQHARVRLRLPVRLRWVAPLGQKSEVCETRNVSKGGLLVACKEQPPEGLPLWVTFPFDLAAPDTQPEVLARVVRRHGSSVGEPEREEIALHFERFPLSASSAREVQQTPVTPPAKNGSVGNVSVPIRVRPRHILWPEEAMTLEVSSEVLRFVSNREYAPGDTLFVSFVSKETQPWPGIGETACKIVNVEKVPQSASLVITLKRVVD
jgi:hypothetical protein